MVVLKIPVRDVVTAELSGWTGGNSLVLIVHAEVGIGLDLSKAEYVEIDHDNRCVVLPVPEPKVMYSRLDHEQKRIHSLNRSGLWQAAIGNAGEDQLTNRAYEEAQRGLIKASSDSALIHKAKEQADHLLNELFGDLGWTLVIR